MPKPSSKSHSPARSLRRSNRATAFLLLILAFFCFASGSVLAEESSSDYSYLEPKFLLADGEYFPLYDAQLANFLRLASNEAYDIGNSDSNYGMGLHPIFGNIDLHEVNDFSIKMHSASDENDTMQLHLRCDFLTAAKTFSVNGEEKNVVLVSFRGTKVSIFDPTDLIIDALIADNDGFHLGFLGCADLAYETLLQVSYPALGGESFASVLEKSKDPESGYYLLVTGHSLGGAVANIFTCRYLNEYTNNPLNTICYTYAAPQVCSSEAADDYNACNIINIKNTKDIIPDVGYLLTLGVTPGHDISASTNWSEEDAESEHSIKHAYSNILQQINPAPQLYYPYFSRSSQTPELITVSRFSNHFVEGKFVDNSIPTGTDNRFAGYQIELDGGTLGVYNGVTLPDIFIRNNGQLSCDTNKANCIDGDIIVESGALSLADGCLSVKNDLRLQSMQADGSYSGSSGHLLMHDEKGQLIVNGDVWLQGGSTGTYQKDLTAGTLEVKGDFSVLPSSGGQCEMVFCPGGTHRVLLSGNTGQTIYFAPYVSETSYICAFFNILESTNPNPLIVPQPISMEYLNHDLSFAGDVSFNNMGNLMVNSDVSLQADNIFLVDYASFKAYAKLTLKANLSGGRLDVGKYEEATGNVLINGNLNGTDLYYAATQEPGTVQVQGNYINNNADIVLCNGQLIVMGDFRHQLQSDTDSYTSADSPFASIYEGSQIQIGGDFFLQMAAGGNFGLPKECSFMLQGDFIQICDAEKPDFWNHGIGNLILNGATAQSVNAPGFYFTNITLANTSTDGVSFLHPLYGISDVFNAYGRSDGTITPYSFPRAAAPTWKDADNDSIPDCLDPEPLEKGDYTMLPAAIGDGCKSEDEDTVSFIYAPTSEQMPQSSTVLAALYAKDKLVELRTVELIMESGQIQKLEIELPSHDIDCVKIFQLNTAAFEPLWFASCWSNSEQ